MNCNLLSSGRVEDQVTLRKILYVVADQCAGHATQISWVAMVDSLLKNDKNKF